MTSEVSWLGTWLKAQIYLHARDYPHAIELYRSLDTHGLLKDNCYLLVNMAYCYHYMCEDKKAISHLQRVSKFNEFEGQMVFRVVHFCFFNL